MRSIVYGGVDFSRYCSAVVVSRGVHALSADSLVVPGRAGALPLPAHVPPEDVAVRLMLDCGYAPGSSQLSQIRHEVRSWLCKPGCATLVLPDDPELEYRDALLTDAASWTDLFETGECEVAFTLFDPVAYGMERVERTRHFGVGGTWTTLPVISMTASAGASVQVSNVGVQKSVLVEKAFEGGEVVVIDCEAESVKVDDVDTRNKVALGSDFFALEPGACELAFAGCSAFEVRFRERWS